MFSLTDLNEPIKYFTHLKRLVNEISKQNKGIEYILPCFVLQIFKSKNIFYNSKIFCLFSFDYQISKCNKMCPHYSSEIFKDVKNVDVDIYENTNFYKILVESAIEFINELGFNKLNIDEAKYLKNIQSFIEKPNILIIKKDGKKKKSKSFKSRFFNK